MTYPEYRGYYDPPAPPRKPKVRVFTWSILVINALFLAWLIAGIVGASTNYGTNCRTLDQRTCEAATGIGGTIGVLVVMFIWMAVDVILGIIWLVTRPRTANR